ncbi:carbon-nitrogen hydrolase family protein [Sodalis sp. RH22]|uniref:carbon-nitrogen hydrolase family protein n=1 Tax=unclassified Sodalis (in: enterobacteria) TaxID=2636512 RepID=UPI0039B3D1E8
MPITFNAAVVQTLAVLGDLKANIALATDGVKEAVRQGAKLIVLPECMNTGYLFDSAQHCRALAEPVDGKYCRALASLCIEYNVFIASGMTELGDDGKIYNSGVLFDPTGVLICHYQKQFLATHDQNWFEVGIKGNPWVDTELGRLGLLICFDGRIPEIARCLAAQNVDVVIDMANFFAMDQAELWVPARAYENGCWIIAATKSGVERSIYYPGGSMIVDPQGRVQARIPYDTHGVVTARVELAGNAASPWSFGGDKMADRRPPAYGIIAQPFETTPLSVLLREPLVAALSSSKVAAVQAHVSAAHTLDDALEMIEHAAQLGVKVMALPACFASPVWCPDQDEARRLAREAETVMNAVTGICKRHQALVALPSTTGKNGQLRHELLLIGPDGIMGRQPQVHNGPRAAQWASGAEAGFTVFDTRYGRIGLLNDYDGMFPESSRVLTLLGADIILWSCAWEHPNQRNLLAVTKAEDNRVYIVCANRTDSPFPGGSLVIPPTGFTNWNLSFLIPPDIRWGAVTPLYAHRALTRQKEMIPGVDMVRNRQTGSYSVLINS